MRLDFRKLPRRLSIASRLREAGHLRPVGKCVVPLESPKLG